MPTNEQTRRKRFLATGHFDETPGYVVNRPAGCHDWLLIYTLRGGGQFHHAAGTFESRPHEAVLLAPDTPHRYEVAPNAEQWELLWAHFLSPSHWKPWLRWPGPAPGWGHLRVPAQRSQIVRRFKNTIDLASGYRHHRESLAVNALEGVLLCLHEQAVEQRGSVVDSRIVDVLDFVCRNLDQTLGVAELAQQSHLSPSRFAHLFREEMQMTPQQFVEQQRMERACELLEHTGYSIAEIARQLGFESPFYFTRRFKLATGKSPRDFRQQSAGS